MGKSKMDHAEEAVLIPCEKRDVSGNPLGIEAGRSKKERTENGLTVMQESFCQHYAATGDAYTSFVRAGYRAPDPEAGKADARHFLKLRRIQRRIEEIKVQMSEERKVTVQNIIDNFMKVYETCMRDADFANANRALENVGKHLGMFVEQKKITVSPFTASADRNEMINDIKRLADAANLEIKIDADKA